MRKSEISAVSSSTPDAGALKRFQLAGSLYKAGRLRDATETYFDLFEQGIRHPRVLAALASSLFSEGRVEEAIIANRAAIDLDPLYFPTWSNLLLSLAASDRLSPVDIFSEHEKFGQYLPSPDYLFPGRRPGKLRLGFLCAWFTHHTVGRFAAPVIAGLNRDIFNVFCYETRHHESPSAAAIRDSADTWRDLSGLSDEEALAVIRRDDIDLLVELDGHTGGNRLPMLARRAARNQITWLGYPNTTGVLAMDYRMVDSISDPAPYADALNTEQLIRLGPPFLVFTPPEVSPPVSPLPALANGYPTFGLFNQLHKYTGAYVSAAVEIVKHCPGSRLVIRARSCRDPGVAAETVERFASQGIDPTLIDCRGPADYVDYLSSYSLVDFTLDTFPYTGTTTTCESLWMGAPVLTLEGLTHRERVTSSLLSSSGFPEFAARSLPEYVERAVHFATDPSRLSSLRAGMRQQLLDSPLMNLPAFIRRFQDALLTLTAANSPRR